MNPGILVAIVAAVIVLLLLAGLRTVQQGTVAVTTVFGKYRRTLRPGLNIVIPFFEKIYRRISVQNRAVELQFQAITQDQANVYFTAMMVYGAINESEDTIKNIAFKFVTEKDFLTALVRSVEGSTRGFVATKRQAEILALRGEIVAEVKDNLDHVIETWGFHLIDLQLNDITFDQAITTSMAQVVASNNLKAAATNEGDALLIRKTKEAEALGTAVRIEAEAERTAAQLRGQGVALFREEVARGLAQAARELDDNSVDASLILFSMWTESIRHMAENGKGNVLFLDGSPDGMQKQMRDLMALQQLRVVEGNQG
ncbi:MAG: SPFH domain-containing protein [Acidobacteria bacterium]|nr:SPFH domain-containing protein [Acidobacteriota bacterium]